VLVVGPESNDSFLLKYRFVDEGDGGVNDARWFQGAPILVSASGNGRWASCVAYFLDAITVHHHVGEHLKKPSCAPNILLRTL
jgi:hypothetical protein